jgi:hypothetical protein
MKMKIFTVVNYQQAAAAAVVFITKWTVLYVSRIKISCAK